MTFAKRLGVCSLMVLALLPKPARAYPLDLDWRQIRTPHFVIIYPEDAAQAAAAEAEIAEAAYAKVRKLCGSAPAGPIPVVLNSRQDQANGITYGFMPKIELYLAPPVAPWEGTLNRDWLEFVTTHELTHLCYGTRAAGFSRVVNLIFGEVTFFNFIAPQWWVEGVAEYGETELTAGGRGRSPYHDMLLAANWLSSDPWSLGQASNFPETDYPFDRPYIVGVDLVEGLADVTRDPAFLDKASRQQSAWPFFGIGFAWKRALKVRLGPLFEEVRSQRTQAYRKRFGQERPALPGAETVLALPGGRYSQPHWENDRTLTGYAATPDAVPAIIRLGLGTGKVTTLAEPGLLAGRLGSQPGGGFVYSRLLSGATDSDVLTADVFRWTPDRGEQRVTRDARCWSPNIDPQGRMVVVRNDYNASHLAILEPGGSWRHLPAPVGATYYAPCWSPDGKRLAAAVRINGCQDICLVDPANGSLTALTRWDAAGDFDPAWSPDGGSLFFVSDRTSVHQIYQYDLATQAVRQITDSRMGAFEPAVSPDGKRLAFAEYRVGNRQDWVVAPLPAVLAPALSLPETGPQPQAPEALSLPPVEGQDYAPGPHLLPTFWIPDLVQDRQSVAVGVYTGRQDPLRWHTWSAQALCTPESGASYGELTYTYAALPVALSLDVFSMPFYRAGVPGDLSDETLYWARRRGGTVSASLPVILDLRERGETALQLDAGYSQYQLLEGDRPVFVNSCFRSVQGSAVFASTNRTEKDYFPTTGMELSLSGEASLSRDEFDGRLVSAAAESYWPGPEHTAAVIGLRASQLAGRLPESVTCSVPRGYAGGVFNAGQTAMLSLGYRMPLWDVDRGPGIFPIFLHGFWVEWFGDWGAGWNGRLASPEDWYRQSAWSYGLQLHTNLEWFWSVTSSVVTTLAVRQDGGVYSNLGMQLGF